MFQRSSAASIVLFASVLTFVACSGCSSMPSEASWLGAKVRQIRYKAERAEIAEVQAKISARVLTVPDHPADSTDMIHAYEAYADAYAQADVSHCPEDFRRQFYQARQAWTESATDLRDEALFLRRRQNQVAAEADTFALQAAEFDRRTNAAIENALSQLQELRTTAKKYGAEWP